MRRKERKISDSQTIDSIFEAADVCRVAFADNNIPYIVTLNFGYQPGAGGILYFHCAKEGRKIEMMKKNDYVCFEVDTDHILYRGPKACNWGMKYKSIVGYGRISVINDPDERKRGLNMIMDHYGANGMYDYDEKELARTAILRLEITEISGKQA
jgi:hypothetical protein